MPQRYSEAETPARRLKIEAGRRALADWERENRRLTEAERREGLARARASLRRTASRRSRRPSVSQ